MPDEIESAILSGAQGPQEAQSDNIRVKQHPIPDLIEADKYLSSKGAMASGRRGLRMSKIQSPSAV